MLRAIQILLNKFLTFICKIFHKNGSVFPGSITYNINQHILEKIKYPKYVIGVTGSSGKGTTTNLIYHILKNAGLDVCYNASGSNGIRAITTLILNNCDIFGRFKHEVLLLELDERHLHLAFGKNKMTHLVLTNITRDQPARNGSPDLVYDSIMNALDGKTTLIINADDAGLMRSTLNYKGNIITYGIDKFKDSYGKNECFSTDNQYCPNCHSKLHYDYYHYGHMGNYHCPTCSFSREPLDIRGTNLDLDKQTIDIDGEKIGLNKNILYTAYATVAAYSLCKTIGIAKDKILDGLNVHKIPSKRAHLYNIFGRQMMMLESKNENALSYYQSLRYIKNQENKKTVVLGFDNVSRRYKFNDLSWLWDVSFELLNDPNISYIVLIGRFRYDVAVRLEYAGIDFDKIIFVDDTNDIMHVVKSQTKGDIYTMVCFDMTDIILNQIKDGGHDEV